jgi:hypothetical protein
MYLSKKYIQNIVRQLETKCRNIRTDKNFATIKPVRGIVLGRGIILKRNLSEYDAYTCVGPNWAKAETR